MLFGCWKYISKTSKKFQELSYHTDVMKGRWLSYVAPPSSYVIIAVLEKLFCTLKSSKVAILKVKHCNFCIYKLIYASINRGLFTISNCCTLPVDLKKWNYVFFPISSLMNQMLKKRKVLWRYKWASKCNKLQCSTFKIATCGTFLKITYQKFDFFKIKNYAS